NPAEALPVPGAAAVSSADGGAAGGTAESPGGVMSPDPPDETPEEPDPYENRAGDEFEPTPYEDLDRDMAPAARLLAEALSVREPHVTREWVPYGGRYHVRADMRTDGARAFVASEAPGLTPPKSLAIQLLLDRTGSMAGRSSHADLWRKDEAARRAAMLLYLACHQLGVPLAIMAFRDNVLIQEFGQWSPMVQALLAGFHGYGTGAYLCRAIRARRAVLEARPERTRLLLVVHDGLPECTEDERQLADLLRQVHQPARGLYVLGLYLGQNPDEIAGMERYFERRLLVCSHLDRLPDMLANQLRAWRGRG
ncbi:MAG: hypothetical protein KKB13_00360, partial [Chloroflexi bacterium]|nr:hypothetical protein [Chloroflexota bacterium]